MKLFFYIILFIHNPLFVFSQTEDYSTSLIADSLKINANAVVRLEVCNLNIVSQQKMIFNNRKVITILNENGLEAIRAVENYNKSTSINSIEAIILNSFGKEIKKIKRRDFKDRSSAGGGTLFSENRYLYLDYTPTEYPFTVIYQCEIETSNTAFIPNWMPLENYFVSVEKSILNVNFPDNLGFKKKEFNFLNFKIVKNLDNSKQISYSATNISAKKSEIYSPLFSDIFPKVMMGLEKFHLENVDGNAQTWSAFGQWYSDKILSATTDLPEQTKNKIKELVGNETDLVKKAKIVYDFVQQKTRYVSIQVGIGGWKPMLASDVDRLGYGDCKALTNYTKALLNIVNVQSYNTILYGDSNKKDIQSDFISMQGNHMILAIPNEKKYIFLECTSQVDPFGYQGTFTDDRDVLIVKPEGGEIVRTKIYEDKCNTQISKGSYALSENGDLSGEIAIISEGSQYNSKYDLETTLPTEKEAHYKDYWNNINNLKITKTTFQNDIEKISFTENVDITAANYGTIIENKIIFVANVYNQYTGNIKKIRNRKNPFEIQRGYNDLDEIKIQLPKNFKIEILPKNFELNTKFGDYKTEIIKTDDNNLVYKRTIFIKKGLYKNTEYDEYRLFMEQVNKNDNAKIIISKN